jgi:hypothetical protein
MNQKIRMFLEKKDAVTWQVQMLDVGVESDLESFVHERYVLAEGLCRSCIELVCVSVARTLHIKIVEGHGLSEWRPSPGGGYFRTEENPQHTSSPPDHLPPLIMEQ